MPHGINNITPTALFSCNFPFDKYIRYTKFQYYLYGRMHSYSEWTIQRWARRKILVLASEHLRRWRCPLAYLAIAPPVRKVRRGLLPSKLKLLEVLL